MTVLLYGQLIGRSVIQEKTGKTVEILLSSVNPTELLLGKITGMALAALLQYGVWIGMGTLFAVLGSSLLDFPLPASLSFENAFFLLLFFFCGFALYSSAYAAFGSAAEDDQHLSQISWPLLVFLVLPMILISSLMNNPEGLVVRIFSLFPFTSPILMFLRIQLGSPSGAEIFLSVVLLVAAIVLMLLVASRIFDQAILRSGKKAGLKDLLLWLKRNR